MRHNARLIVVAGGLLIGAEAWSIAAAEESLGCPIEVAQARAMVARAKGVVQGTDQKGDRAARTAGLVPPPGRPLDGTPGADAARGLAVSPASDVSPWHPSPGDKTLQARATQAGKMTDEAQLLCRAGKADAAKAKAVDAMGILRGK